jgi:cytochrome oxidase assembly protein ShyY1
LSKKTLSKRQEEYSLLKSLIAILLIAGCLWAAQWQFHRGVARHDRNSQITSHIDLPIVPLAQVSSSPEEHEWQRVRVAGTFDASRQILLRNHYNEGKYGYEVLTAFTTDDGEMFWVDRGWVQAGATATEQPELPATPTEQVTIIGRIRLDTSLPQGNFFAIPTGTAKGLISEANAQSTNSVSGIDSRFYLDLLEGNVPELTPAVVAEVPELTDGPHFAYALQWVIFAGLVVYGRFLIRREVLTREEISVEA